MKREISIVLPLILLSAAFAIISLLVILSRQHPWTLRKKLKIGGMIIALNAVTPGCNGPPMVTCYAPVPPEYICITEKDEGCRDLSEPITIPADEIVTLTGQIISRESSEFSFRVLDQNQEVKIQEDLVPPKGEFSDYVEEFEISIDGSALSPGPHSLELFPLSIANLQTDAPTPLSSYDLLVE